MNIIKRLKQAFDPINTMTPHKIVASMPTVWFRVPLAIYTGYFENKTTEAGVVDYEAIATAMAGTDIVVYGRNQRTAHKEAPLQFAYSLLSEMKDGSEKEKIEDATMVLLMGEMKEGGTNISMKLAIKSVDLGFLNISKPAIETLFDTGYPPSEETIAKIAEVAMKEAMAT